MEMMNRRTFVRMPAALLGGKRAPANWMERRWTPDARCVIPRGAADEFDGGVAQPQCPRQADPPLGSVARVMPLDSVGPVRVRR